MEGKGRMKERKRKGSRQSLSGPVSLVLAPSLFRSCSLVVVLGGLMVGGGWKSIALNNEPQGSTLTPLSTVWSSLSCILSFQTERESNSLYPSRAFPPFPYFPSLSLPHPTRSTVKRKGKPSRASAPLGDNIRRH